MIFVPRLTRASNVLFLRNFNVFVNNIFFQVFEGLIQPIMYLLCFGYVLGAWFDITVVESYTKFLFLGILLCIPMSVASYEVCYSSNNYLLDKGINSFVKLFPIKTSDIFIASFMWSVFKSLIITGIFLVIGYVLNLVSAYIFLEILLLATAIAAFFSALTIFLSTYFNWQHNGFNNILYFLIPLFLFSGTFFPTNKLPIIIEQIAHYNPLGFGIYLSRNVSLLEGPLVYFAMIGLCLLTSLILLTLSLHRYQRLQSLSHR